MIENKGKIANYLKKLNFNLDIKLKIIEAGGSEVLKDWEKYGLITKDEFIEALTWVCNDPLNDDGRLTRKIGLQVTPDMKQKIMKEENPKFYLGHDENNLRGEIVKLKKVYGYSGEYLGLYKVDDNMLWSGVSIDAKSRI